MHIGVWQNAYMHYLILKCIWAFSKRRYAPPFPINSTSLLPQSCSFSRFLLFFFSSSLIQCCCCFVFFLLVLLMFFISCFLVVFDFIMLIWSYCFSFTYCLLFWFYIFEYHVLWITLVIAYVYIYYSLCVCNFGINILFLMFLNIFLPGSKQSGRKMFFIFFLENTYRRFAKRRYEILLFNTAHRRFIKRLCA